MAGDMDAGLARWLEVVGGRVEFACLLAAGEPRVSASDKWRYWKVDLEDGSRVSINFCDKAGGKCIVGASHDKLPSPEAAERAKASWKALLAEL